MSLELEDSLDTCFLQHSFLEKVFFFPTKKINKKKNINKSDALEMVLKSPEKKMDFYFVQKFLQVKKNF